MDTTSLFPRPILHSQPGDTGEFTFVTCHYGCPESQCMGGNQRIKRSNRTAISFQIGANLAIAGRRDVIERADLQRSAKLCQRDLIAGWIAAPRYSVLKFGKRYR